jgi:CRISPR/Cas system-associated endoribonuclease Cas2
MTDITSRQILEYQTDINKIIDSKQDDIKIYRFDKKTKISIYGKDSPLDYLLPKNFTKIRSNK